MSNAPQASVLARSPLGAYWINRSSHGQTANERFVFFQDPQGRIRYASGGSGVSTTAVETNEAALNSQFAALGWGWQTSEIRLYFLDKNNDIQERTTRRQGPPDGINLRPGNLSGVKAASNSNLAAIRYVPDPNGNQTEYYVFYQVPDTNEIAFVWTKNEDTWEKGTSKLPAGINSTSIAAAIVNGEIKLHYQKPDTSIVTYRGNLGPGGIEGWKQESFESQSKYNPGAAIAAAGDKTFTVSNDNNLNVHGPDGSQDILGSVIPSAAVTAISYPQTAVQKEALSVYSQTVESKITEFVLRDGKWAQNDPVSPQ